MSTLSRSQDGRYSPADAQVHPPGLSEVVYTPENQLRNSARLFRQMVADAGRSRELAWRLFVRDVQARYRQSVLGYFWALAPPIASTLLFVFLQSQKILNIGATDVPYAVYVLTGMVLWQTFTAALRAPLGQVQNAKSMLSKLNFPREALLLCGFYHVMFTLGIKLMLLIGVYIVFMTVPAWTVLLVPLGILSLVLLGFALGLLLVPLGTLYQDIGSALGMGLSAWMLLTPVVYPPPTSGMAAWLTTLNPVSPLLITTRQMATTGELSYLGPSLIITFASIVALLGGWTIYRLAMPHLIARMNA